MKTPAERFRDSQDAKPPTSYWLWLNRKLDEAEAALDEARQALANEKNEWRIACNLMDESQRNLRAAERQVTQQADTISQLRDALDKAVYIVDEHDGWCAQIAGLRDAALASIPDEAQRTRVTCDHCKGGINGRHEVFCQVYAVEEHWKLEVTQQAATISQLREALKILDRVIVELYPGHVEPDDEHLEEYRAVWSAVMDARALASIPKEPA